MLPVSQVHCSPSLKSPLSSAVTGEQQGVAAAPARAGLGVGAAYWVFVGRSMMVRIVSLHLLTLLCFRHEFSHALCQAADKDGVSLTGEVFTRLFNTSLINCFFKKTRLIFEESFLPPKRFLFIKVP